MGWYHAEGVNWVKLICMQLNRIKIEFFDSLINGWLYSLLSFCSIQIQSIRYSVRRPIFNWIYSHFRSLWLFHALFNLRTEYQSVVDRAVEMRYQIMYLIYRFFRKIENFLLRKTNGKFLGGNRIVSLSFAMQSIPAKQTHADSIRKILPMAFLRSLYSIEQ